MVQLRIYIKTQGGNRVAPEGIHITYLKRDDFGPFNRMEERRGLTFLTSRTASEEEMNNEGFGGYRIGFMPYNDWDKLICDEKEYTLNAGWLDQLERLKAKYPQFTNKTQTTLRFDQ